jgi:hypothetical protein
MRVPRCHRGAARGGPAGGGWSPYTAIPGSRAAGHPALGSRAAGHPRPGSAGTPSPVRGSAAPGPPDRARPRHVAARSGPGRPAVEPVPAHAVLGSVAPANAAPGSAAPGSAAPANAAHRSAAPGSVALGPAGPANPAPRSLHEIVAALRRPGTRRRGTHLASPNHASPNHASPSRANPDRSRRPRRPIRGAGGTRRGGPDVGHSSRLGCFLARRNRPRPRSWALALRIGA